MKKADWKNEIWLDALFAQISRIAYTNAKPAKKYFKALGFTKHTFIDVDGAQAHIVEDKIGNLVFAFRGTEPTELSDIAADLKAWKMKSRTAGRVHDGFFDETNKIWPNIENYKQAGKTLWICGHSLGGAMATISATRLCQGSSPRLFTYGSPKVGNTEWLSFNSGIDHHRFVNTNDAVTKVPPRLLGFKHQGKLCYINYYGNIRDLTVWQRIKDHWRARWRALQKGQPFAGFVDHSIGRYTTKLVKLCELGRHPLICVLVYGYN